MMYIKTLITLILVMQLATSTGSFQLSWELAKCLTSRPAIMLTYLASMTGTRNYSYIYCKRKMGAFRSPSLGGNKAGWSPAHLLAGGSLLLHLLSNYIKHQNQTQPLNLDLPIYFILFGKLRKWTAVNQPALYFNLLESSYNYFNHLTQIWHRIMKTTGALKCWRP